MRASGAGPLALVGVRLWDGIADGPSRPVTLRIERGRIAAIGDDPGLARGALAIETGPDAVAVPGLVDAHVHLTLDPELRSAAGQARVPPGVVSAGMEARARAMLRAGITTARDLGGGAWLEIALRDRIERGGIPGPRLLCAGQPLTSPGGHCHFWGGEAADEAQLRALVRTQVRRGADWIKIMATGGLVTAGTQVREAQFDLAALRAVRDEADAHGRPVAAHAHGTAGIRRAAEAGLRTIEHCSFAGEGGFGADFDPGVAARLAEQPCWVSPTVNSGWRRFFGGGEGSRFLRDMRACHRRLRRAGVRMIASTDAGIPGVRHDDLPRALGVFAAFAGFSPVEVLRAATSEPARCFGLEDEIGRLAPGLAADVLVTDGDPLADLEALERPLLVLARGQIVRDGIGVARARPPARRAAP